MIGISAILNTKNEASLLKECLESIRPHVDEIIVTDMESSDGSEKIAEEYGARVIHIPPALVVEETLLQKIVAAKNDWIFSLDPDMRIPPDTWKKINEAVASGRYDAVAFHMNNRVFGRWVQYGHGSECNFYKLFKKSVFLRKGMPESSIHGMVYDAVKDGRILFLDRAYPILHLAYDDVGAALRQHLRYAEYEAKQLFGRGERVTFLKSVKGVARKFVGDFVMRKAWRGGKECMVFSLIALLMVIQRDIILSSYQTSNEKRV